MKLYLQRHMKAESKTLLKEDTNRLLTEEGREAASKKAKNHKNKLKSLDFILTSPYPRARETAEIFATVLEKTACLEMESCLTPMHSPMSVLAMLLHHKSFEEMMLVGHEPLLTQVGSLLVTGRSDCQFFLKKGGWMILEMDEIKPEAATLLKLG